jgi:hypothetical protein
VREEGKRKEGADGNDKMRSNLVCVNNISTALPPPRREAQC